jgi:hypothetical protein
MIKCLNFLQKIDELISGEFSDEAVEEIETELERIIGESLPEVPQDELEKLKKTEKTRQKGYFFIFFKSD